jgi:hypothetical protein
VQKEKFLILAMCATPTLDKGEAKPVHKRQTSSQRILHKDNGRKGSGAKKYPLVLSLKGLGAKTN